MIVLNFASCAGREGHACMLSVLSRSDKNANLILLKLKFIRQLLKGMFINASKRVLTLMLNQFIRF